MIVAGGEDIGALFSATTQGALALAETDLDMGKPMATSLYDLSVPTFLQTVRAVGGFLDRAAKHCAETGADPENFVQARLFDDMAPFHFQIEAASHHCVWGLEAVKTALLRNSDAPARPRTPPYEAHQMRADEFDGGEVVFGAFVVAGGDTTEVFDAVEEPFDEVALPVEPAREREALFAVGA